MYLCLECGSTKVIEWYSQSDLHRVDKDKQLTVKEENSQKHTDYEICAECESRDMRWIDDAYIPDKDKLEIIESKEGAKRLLYWYKFICEESNGGDFNTRLLRRKIKKKVDNNAIDLNKEEENELVSELL